MRNGILQKLKQYGRELSGGIKAKKVSGPELQYNRLIDGVWRNEWQHSSCSQVQSYKANYSHQDVLVLKKQSQGKGGNTQQVETAV